ncbi:MAG: hypothetical protein AAB353_11865 [Candidatus Hydrogenedentota bacterium]
MKKPKTFDCIEMKRKIQARMYDETKGMTREQKHEYIRQKIANSRFARFLDIPPSEQATPRPR